MQTDFMPAAGKTDQSGRGGRYIYIACPWTPVGGGMFKVADYLIQSQGPAAGTDAAVLRPLDTRGGASAAWSMVVLAGALLRLVGGRLSGRLAGVHVNTGERLSVVRKGAVIAVCRALGIPVLMHLHAGQLHHNYRAAAAPVRMLLRWLFSLPVSVVVLGKASSDFVTQELRVPAARVQIVINGVPQPTVARRSAIAAADIATPAATDAGAIAETIAEMEAGPRTPHRVLFVGNLSERKGVSDLLHALAQPQFDALPVEATFAGGGDIAKYRSLADRLGLGRRVRFLGWSDQQSVARLLAGADALVLPSYDEGLPLAILEALAHGVAVVCTPVGEIPHVFTDGVDACFVRAGDVASIAAGLSNVLTDSNLRESLERNGRAFYERRFSLDQFCTVIAEIHQRHFGICGRPLAAGRPAVQGLNP